MISKILAERWEKHLYQIDDFIAEEQKLLIKIGNIFYNEFSSDWEPECHAADGQMERMDRATANNGKITLIYYDEKEKTAKIQGSKLYTVSPHGCSCVDFARRGLPCKHIYFLFDYLMEEKKKQEEKIKKEIERKKEEEKREAERQIERIKEEKREKKNRILLIISKIILYSGIASVVFLFLFYIIKNLLEAVSLGR